MTEICINGKSYEVEKDSFGLTRVDGMLVDDFLSMLPHEDIDWLAKYGMKTIQTDHEHFDDIADRIEMPINIKRQLDTFKT